MGGETEEGVRRVRYVAKMISGVANGKSYLRE